MKWALREPPSLKTLRIMAAVTGAFGTGMALWSGPSWIGMVDATAAGFCLANVGCITQAMRMQGSFDLMAKLCHEVNDLNGELISGKIAMHMSGRERIDPPPKPSLH